jgi:hypothetical protein
MDRYVVRKWGWERSIWHSNPDCGNTKRPMAIVSPKAVQELLTRSEYSRPRDCRRCIATPENTNPKLSKSEMRSLVSRAEQAGMAAGNAIVPVPMHVVEHASPLDDNSSIVRRYAPVMGGVCGFAWVILNPATSSLARYLTKNGKGSSAYGGGTQVWVSEFGQSYEKKTAYAQAYSEVLRNAGFDAYSQSRLD